MKTFIVSLILIFMSMPLSAQDNEVETLFGGETEIGGWGGPELKLTQYHGNWGVMLGGKGGTLLNSTLGIGGAGYILMTSHRIDGYVHNVNPYAEKASYLRDMYGGLLLEYINSSDRMIHFTANAIIGAGIAAYTDALKYSDRYNNDDWVREASAYFVFEPGLTVDINLTQFFRFSVGAGYRFISGLDLPKTDANDIGGITAFATFKFGDF